MKKLLLAVIFAAIAIVQSGFAQVPTQEQLQTADAQLNQVYQQLRGSLNDGQKQQLKLAQRDWLKKRDAFVSQNPGNQQGALYQATMQRVTALQGVLQKVSGQLSGQGVTTLAHEETASPTVQQYGINQQQIESKQEKSEALNTVIQNIETDVDCADYSEELGLVVTGSIIRKSIRIYDVYSRKFIREIKCAFPVKAIAFAENKKVILVGNEVKSPLQIAVCSLNGETSELEKSIVDSIAKSGGVYNITSYTPFFSPSLGRLCFEYKTKTGAGINDWRSELKASDFQFNYKQEKTFPLEALL
ncbi:MAG: lysozyme inhibitor LprI family protein, partial [bacterium]